MNDLFERLKTSRNYADVCMDTLERVAHECTLRYKKPKDAEKAAKEKLHGIVGAFMSTDECKSAEAALAQWRTGGDAILADILNRHSSTRERLPLESMDGLYDRIFASAGRPASVLDLACGLNPLYLGARNINATGIDIQNRAIMLINRAHDESGMPVRGICGDLLRPECLPDERFSLALIFKLLPILETQQSGSAVKLLRSVPADTIAVSYPTRTLTGRNIGMEANYSAWMENHLPDEMSVADRFVHGSELVYILRRK